MRHPLVILTVLTLMLGCVLAQPVNAPYNSVPKNASRPILLKLGYNYLLFTYPVAPYLDQNGSVMVPLRVVGELMGGQVYYSERRRAGILIRPGFEGSHLIEFVSGSRQAYVNEEEVPLASAPIWLDKKGELLIPLEPLIDAFDLRPRWDQKRNELALYSDLFKDFSSFELETLPDGYQDTEQLVPSNIALKRQGPGARQVRLSMNLRNVTNSPVRAGHQGVFILAQYGGVGGAFVKGRNTDVPTTGPDSKDPCRKENGEFVCEAVFPAFDQAIYNTIFGNYPMDYLIARIRTRIPEFAK